MFVFWKTVLRPRKDAPLTDLLFMTQGNCCVLPLVVPSIPFAHVTLARDKLFVQASGYDGEWEEAGSQKFLRPHH